MSAVLRAACCALLSLAAACAQQGFAPVPRTDPTPSVVAFDAAESIFPDFWRRAPYEASARPLPDYEKSRARRILEHGLAKYPPALVRQNLKRVQVVRELRFSGVQAAGTNSLDTIFVADDGESDAFLEETLHHEFSSILLRNYAERFPEAAWKGLAPADFRYGESGVDAIKAHHDSLEYDDRLNAQGFLHEYAQASLEDDFNSISEKLFGNDPRFWEIAGRHSKIAAKAALAMRFYRELDPRFTEEYFRSLRRLAEW